MEDFRSKSYAANRTQIDPYNTRGPPFPSYDLRSYSTSHASSLPNRDINLKKGKSVSSSKGKWLSDPDFRRKKRVVGYKVYSVEGRVKGSFRKSFRWLKQKYTRVVYGWR